MHWVPAAEEYFAGSSCGFEWSKDFFLFQINAHPSFLLAACLYRILYCSSWYRSTVCDEFSDMGWETKTFCFQCIVLKWFWVCNVNHCKSCYVYFKFISFSRAVLWIFNGTKIDRLFLYTSAKKKFRENV